MDKMDSPLVEIQTVGFTADGLGLDYSTDPIQRGNFAFADACPLLDDLIAVGTKAKGETPPHLYLYGPERTACFYINAGELYLPEEGLSFTPEAACQWLCQPKQARVQVAEEAVKAPRHKPWLLAIIIVLWLIGEALYFTVIAHGHPQAFLLGLQTAFWAGLYFLALSFFKK